MTIHFRFLFVSKPGSFVCLLIQRQMSISLDALTAVVNYSCLHGVGKGEGGVGNGKKGTSKYNALT